MNQYRIPTFILLVFTAFLMAGCAGTDNAWETHTVTSYVSPKATAYAQPHAIVPTYTVGHGDKLQVRVFGEPALTGEYSVDGSGVMSMPLLRGVKVAGLTTKQIEHRITGLLRRKFLKKPNVSVEIRTFRPFFILGEVTRAGQYPYVDGMSVQTAVAIAGGYTPRAKRSKVKVTRRVPNGGADTIILHKYEAIMPGDTITVRERFF